MSRFTSVHETTPKEKSPFTLVEMLVTIAVIAILTSVLLPALAKAKGAAVAIHCASNLRQQMLALSSYCADYDGYIPCASPDANSASLAFMQGMWAVQLSKYLGIDINNIYQGIPVWHHSVLKCPRTLPPISYATNINLRSYGYNWRLADGAAWAWPLSVSRSTKLDRIRDGSEVYIIGDSNDYLLDSFSQKNHAHEHGKRAVILFLDGHTGSFSYNEFPTLRAY